MNQGTLQTISTAYGSSIDALDDLRESSEITDITSSLSHLANGIEYSFVEITCSDGIQYGLQAYGNEALELSSFSRTFKYIFKKHEPKVKVPLRS